MKKPEILAPAGDMERLQAALDFGADAVYLSRKAFGMRAAAPNFTAEQLKEAVALAHAKGVKVYLTCNTLPRNDSLPDFPQYVEEAVAANVDAMIVADLGLLRLLRKLAPQMELHMSTQTGIVNYETCQMLYELGVRRAVLARELSLQEIADIRAHIPDDMELEVFVHGAMCMSFSGRCLISAYLTGRDANQGACAQPCRWQYYVMEQTRPGQYFPIEESKEGTYLFNAKDLCMIEHIPELVEAGVTSLKIEGRAKSAYYVSVITNAYRMAMDAYLADPSSKQLPEWIRQEVFQVSHREYCTGFFYGAPQAGQRYADNLYVRRSDVVAIVEDWKDGMLYATQRNRFFATDELELLMPGKPPVPLRLTALYQEDGTPISVANHAMMKLSMPCATQAPPRAIIRRTVPEVA